MRFHSVAASLATCPSAPSVVARKATASPRRMAFARESRSAATAAGSMGTEPAPQDGTTAPRAAPDDGRGWASPPDESEQPADRPAARESAIATRTADAPCALVRRFVAIAPR